MKTNQFKIIQAALFLSTIIVSVEIFALDAKVIHPSETEAGIEETCDCQTKAPLELRSGKAGYGDLTKIIDEGLKPYYFKKYHIDEYIAEKSDSSALTLKSVEEKLNRNLISLTAKEQEALMNIGMGGATADLDRQDALSKLFTGMDAESPFVKNLALKYAIRIHISAHTADQKGGKINQGNIKSISLEPSKIEERTLNGNLIYSKCTQLGSLDIGPTWECSAKAKLGGSLEVRVLNSFYTGAKFAASQLDFKGSEEGYAFIRFKF